MDTILSEVLGTPIERLGRLPEQTKVNGEHMAADSYSLTISRIFQAPRARLFEAWMNPEDLKKWWHMSLDATTPIAEVDLRVGGRYTLGMTAPDSDEVMALVGKFLIVEPPELLEYTWAWEGAENEPVSTVRVEFKDLGQSTEVVITHGVFVSEQRRQQHIDGWQGCMDQLDPILS